MHLSLPLPALPSPLPRDTFASLLLATICDLAFSIATAINAAIAGAFVKTTAYFRARIALNCPPIHTNLFFSKSQLSSPSVHISARAMCVCCTRYLICVKVSFLVLCFFFVSAQEFFCCVRTRFLFFCPARFVCRFFFLLCSHKTRIPA
jgi:hypothetical protein